MQKEQFLSKNTEMWSEVISSLRIPLAICVVFIHFDVFKIENFVFYQEIVVQPEWARLFVYFFSDILPCVAVPLFFFFSGFLFFQGKRFDKRAYKQKLHSRAKPC